MPKRENEELTHFGRRLAELRKAAGYTQVELAEEIGVTQRVISYFEVETSHPPTTLLPLIAQALRITTDALLGATPVKQAAKPSNTRLRAGFRKSRSSTLGRSGRSCNFWIPSASVRN